MTLSSPKILACLALLHAGACSVSPEEDPSNDSDAPGDDLQPIASAECNQNLRSDTDGCQMQGRRLLSNFFDELAPPAYFSVSSTGKAASGRDVKVKLVDGASLQATEIGPGGATYPDTDARFADMKLFGAGGEELRIVSASDAGAFTLFVLSYGPSSAGVNPCENGEAVALAGYFNDTGRHKVDASQLTFACKDEGVAYKCINWGFPPGADPTKVEWKAHQVCTRLARADYCKDGTTHTLDETYVRIWDNYLNLGFPARVRPFPGLSVWPPPVAPFKVEAAWPEDDDLPAACLSKTRWEGLKLGELDSCSLELGDPREDRSASFCDDLGADILGQSMINESRYADTRLEEWQLGGDLVSTVYGYYPGPWSGPGRRPVPVLPPFSPNSGYTHVETQGVLLRSLPGSIEPSEVSDVYSYANAAGDRLLGRARSADWPPDDYSDDRWEGKVFIEPPASGVPTVTQLMLYRNSDTDDYVNSTQVLAPPYEWVEDLGYITVPIEE
ncbi:MAG TPA: ADYC domain-containing protein [Candidatus Acidoferrum sp.]|nr:ADYC domain-containing protein [Candidatus Acidoferrum sp.]